MYLLNNVIVMDVIGPCSTANSKGSRPHAIYASNYSGDWTVCFCHPFRSSTQSCPNMSSECIHNPKGYRDMGESLGFHHDENLWDDPFKFKPERLMDADGDLVPADHPNRRNTMPFGAGHRICVGEVLALSRMFLITARILQNFTILPESTVEKQPSCDPRGMKMGVVIQYPYSKVRMMPLSDDGNA